MRTDRLAPGIFVALLLVLPAVLSPFYVTLLNYIGLYALVALGLVLLTGVGGLTSFGQAAFVGLGAYTTAVLSTATGLPGWIAWAGASPWLALLVGLLITGAVALLSSRGLDAAMQPFATRSASDAAPASRLAWVAATRKPGGRR